MGQSLPRIHRSVYSGSRWLGRCFLRLTAQVDWSMQTPLPIGPCVIVCNHISHFDPPALVALLPTPVHVMSMIELFRHGFQHWLRAVGAFPVHRELPDARAARVARRLLLNGDKVLVFPEGGIRSGSESILSGAPLRQGAAALACWTQVPVVPAVCLGTDQLYAWKPFSRPQLIVRLGTPIVPPHQTRGRSLRTAFSREISEAIHALYTEVRCSPMMSEKLIPRSAQERWQESKRPLHYAP
jgi:1-acyl-sn-glycerol-3-phosphate acyltransferase